MSKLGAKTWKSKSWIDFWIFALHHVHSDLAFHSIIFPSLEVQTWGQDLEVQVLDIFKSIIAKNKIGWLDLDLLLLRFDAASGLGGSWNSLGPWNEAAGDTNLVVGCPCCLDRLWHWFKEALMNEFCIWFLNSTFLSSIQQQHYNTYFKT